MRILHCMLSCFYVEGYKYQENIIPAINKRDGHDVKIIASTVVFSNNNSAGFTKSGKFINEDGIEVVRLPYAVPNKKMGSILKAYSGVIREVNDFQPDVILYHGAGGHALLDVVRYVKKNNVKLYVDCHQFYQNSATNWLSKHILHRVYNRFIMQKADPYVEKYLPVTYECKIFLHEMYDIDYDRMRLYPLGGLVLEQEEIEKYREDIRKKLEIEENEILLVHSGKIDPIKKTNTILSALKNISSKTIKLVIIGSISEDIKENLMSAIENDNRVIYLGWKSSDELLKYLCAGDLYLQPGGMSVTLQNAMCCGCAVATYPHKGYTELIGDKAFYVENSESIEELLKKIISNDRILIEKKKQAYEFAKKNLDYKELVRILCE